MEELKKNIRTDKTSQILFEFVLTAYEPSFIEIVVYQ